MVMILPLITAYFLFAWINSYNNEQKVEEHVQLRAELEDVKQKLNNPALYASQADRRHLERDTDQTKLITLYDKNGVIVYSSNPSIQSTQLKHQIQPVITGF